MDDLKGRDDLKEENRGDQDVVKIQSLQNFVKTRKAWKRVGATPPFIKGKKRRKAHRPRTRKSVLNTKRHNYDP
ncbi:GNAT family N-acetyltransferase [Sesbania bispinosa]|nr:GNAT family N-acetyltransferase [Sesbania bispinosa]